MDASPLAGSENTDVKYIQSPMSMNDESKQEQSLEVDKLKDQADFSDVKKMTEQEGMFAGAGGDGTQSSADAEAASAASILSGATQSDDQSRSALAAGASETSALSSPQSSSLSSESSSEPSVAENPSAFTEASSSETGDVDGIAKSLSKASSMTTDAVMDLLKSGKVPGTDFSNADVSAGPDPYDTNGANSDESLSSLLGGSKSSSPGGDDGSNSDESLSSLLGGSKSSSPGGDDTAGSLESAASDLTGGLGGSLSSLTSEQSLGSEDLSSRSTEGSEQQQSDESYERNTIPLEENNSYRTRYNTEIFKKHVIMRPKRDTYVSPFGSKDAFDTAI